MCGGCGKRFERKAALHSHSQMCARRIALCNTIKENSIKQAMEEARIQKIAQKKIDNLPKGAEKRKPSVIRKRIDLIEPKRESNEECAEPKIVICNGDDANTLNNEILVETVTIDPFNDFEQDYDMLSMETEDFSVFRSSMSPTDVCNIIGVPIVKKTDDKKLEEFVPDDNSSSNCSLVQLFRDDNSKTLYNRLDADIETTLKEISSLHQSPSYSETCDKPVKRKCSNSTKETALESKAKEYVDMQDCSCLPCDAKFDSKHALMEHMSRHFNWFSYQCRRCNYMSYYEDTCLKHVRKEHAVSENVVLPVPNWKVLKLSTDFTSLTEANENGLKPTSDDSETRKMIMEVIFGSNVDTSNFLGATKKSVPEQKSRPVRTRRKSIKVVQHDFLYDFDIISKKSAKNCESSNDIRKPLRVYSKKTNTNKKDAKGTSLADKTAANSTETSRIENNKV